jgi:hypothetical protein
VGGETDRPHVPGFGVLGSAKPGPMPGCIRHQAAPMDDAENPCRTILPSICPSDLSRQSINVGELRPTIFAGSVPSLDEA